MQAADEVAGGAAGGAGGQDVEGGQGGPGAPAEQGGPGGPGGQGGPGGPGHLGVAGVLGGLEGPEGPEGPDGPNGPDGPDDPGVGGEAGAAAGGVPPVERAPDAPGPGGDAAPAAGGAGGRSLQFTLTVPFPTPMEAEIAHRFLTPNGQFRGPVQKELKVTGTVLAVRLTGEDPGQLRISITSCLDQLILVMHTMQLFVPPFFTKSRAPVGN
ncbi:uncharacterized protein LOC143670793 [Tamandua tetradactyla]|uniref:uncharacterized protein LOC143670793 n=1 Tax=Tamandua tetradactyla TaxID=48850 RepID=UPI004053BB6B